MTRLRVLALGQLSRGDDAAGLLAAALLPPGLDVVRGAADPAAVLAQLDNVDAAVVLDCARGGGAPGDILELPLDPTGWPPMRATTTHGNALAGALALGAALGCLPPSLVLLVVVGADFALGAPVSPAVQAALPALARRATGAARLFADRL